MSGIRVPGDSQLSRAQNQRWPVPLPPGQEEGPEPEQGQFDDEGLNVFVPVHGVDIA